MNDIIKIDHICQYNDLMGVETQNPLVTVVDFSKRPVEKSIDRMYNMNLYVVFLKDVNCGDMVYGRQYYDYQEGTMVFLSPNQLYGIKGSGKMYQPKGYGLLFHPDLIKGTSLGKNIHQYSFFSYKVNEALHISKQERETVLECLQNIQHEIANTIDKHSKTLICNNIELLLNYALRYYDRQFITRENVNVDILTRFEELLSDYYASQAPEQYGLPSITYFADKLNLSPNYFGDLMKRQTGKSPQEYIRMKVLDSAKEALLDRSLSIQQISYQLGFQYPQHFTRMFKKNEGISPYEYRKMALNN